MSSATTSTASSSLDDVADPTGVLFEQGDDGLPSSSEIRGRQSASSSGRSSAGQASPVISALPSRKMAGPAASSLRNGRETDGGRSHAPLQISDISFISRGFSRESGRIKTTLTLSLRLECAGTTRPDPLLMKLISLISIADMDRPSLRQHDKVVIGEDAKDRLEAKL